MISRFALAAGLAVLMVVSSVGSYMYLGSRQTDLTAPPQVPTAVTPSPGAFNLTGTLFLTQSGAIYSLNAGRFHQLTSEAGWTQLALYPGNNLLAVKRSLLFSDVYILNRFGTVIRKLTSNTAPAGNPDTGARHWSFYPRMSHNQKTLFMSYDKPKAGFDVPMTIWAMPIGKPISQATRWTTAIDYTGGDMQPLPLPSGALMYTKFLYFNQRIVSQIWITNKPEQQYYCGAFCITVPPGPDHGTPLTTPGEDCSQPALAPSGKAIAMICTHETQVSYLALAAFNGHTLGPRRNLITNQLVAQPTWAPDSSGIAYLSPAQVGSGFQLWWLPKGAFAPPSATPTPTPTPGSPIPTPSPVAPVPNKPMQLTTNLGFDATSPMAWIP